MASENPIANTVIEKLVITDTSANALVVGGAIGATSGTGGIKGGTVSDSVGSMATIRAGGLALASQASADLMAASSATQWARIAAGTSLQYLRMNSAATAQEWASIAPTLVKEGSGTNSAAGATNVDTFALASTLTIKDTLMVVVRHRNTGNAANVVGILQNSTDTVTVGALSPANNNYYVDVQFIAAQSTTLIGMVAFPFTGTVTAPTRSTFTTAWTGAWTLALHHSGVTAPDTWQWEWVVLKISGQ